MSVTHLTNKEKGQIMRVDRVLMTADTVGGVWTYALDLARKLAGRGCEVTLATMGGYLPHAEARAVRVRMELGARGLDVAVEDDGKGYDPRANVGRGLGNMARRVERLGGELRVDPVAPHGTRVAMSVPASALLFASTEAS